VGGIPHFALALLLSCAAVGLGCSKSNGDLAARETSHVRVLTNLHALATTKLGHVPRDEQELKQTIAKLPMNLDKLKVRSIDELFTSERDGQPLVVVYGPTNIESDVVVYEKTGVNGKRMVGHRIGMVEEVDDAELKKLTTSKQ